MAKNIAMRVTYALLSMLVLLVFVFASVRVTGDPTYSILGPDAPAEMRERLRQEFGLDKPLIDQFAIYLSRVARGDFGTAFRGRQPVTHEIAARVPATLILAGGAIALIVAVGIPLGIYSAYRRGGLLDRFGGVVAALGQSIPSFWLGFVLILVMAVHFRLLPSGGYGGLENMILPVVTLSFGPIAGLVRLLRSSMIEALESDYVAFLRAKGLPESQILWKHALRNAGLTTLGFLGIVVANLLTGSVLVETIFVWPGVGRLMIDSINYRDFPIVQGVVLAYSAVYIGMNLIVDLLYIIANPKLR